MTEMMQISTEQFQQLLAEAVRLAIANGAGGSGNTDNKTKGSLSKCEVRFGGQRNYDEVEEFITNIITYKDVENISDEDALKGLSLCFYGLASTWWQGVRKEAKTWDDALTLIREHFSPAKPAYQVYLEIFEKKQEDDVAIDTFICQKRALLAQLPAERHTEEVELDLIYGLLNIKYRQHIARTEVKTFTDLLNRGRIIEQNDTEAREAQSTGPIRGAKGTKRCTYCNYRGHTQDECRKRKSAEGNQ